MKLIPDGGHALPFQMMDYRHRICLLLPGGGEGDVVEQWLCGICGWVSYDVAVEVVWCVSRCVVGWCGR